MIIFSRPITVIFYSFHFSAKSDTEGADDPKIERYECSHRLYKGPYDGPLYG